FISICGTRNCQCISIQHLTLPLLAQYLLPATLPANTPNTFLYELIRNKHASHIEIFAKKVHGKSFFSTNPGYKYSSAPQYSTSLNLSPPPRTSDNGLKSLRPLATTLLNKKNLA
ncbi:hypothetical protein ACQ3IH_004834, partial [Escherichia coli]